LQDLKSENGGPKKNKDGLEYTGQIEGLENGDTKVGK